jgi:glycosyltransferase involved in cell wall biosynthesis
VLATRSSAIPDVLGDAALYFDPNDPAALEERLSELLLNDALRRTLGVKAAERAQRQTWPAAAKAFLNVLDELSCAKSNRAAGVSCGSA